MPSFSLLRPTFSLLLAGAVLPLGVATAQQEESVITIDMESRRFMPSEVVLPVGGKVKLVLRNHDSELHAFVPGALFAGVNMNVTGNGFPEFTDAGFRRLIVPPDGHAEIGFVPTRIGDYPFVCDMPGHSMKGVILVR
ncbi:MAG TPA: cupredoxin domain-containing protein [Nitrospiraceae bacterium]|nr:cupredoxin domain-containing protein [Nitrospiraceae bacterium]